MKHNMSVGMYNIYNDFPHLKEIYIIENLYTIFNSGPDSSIIETAVNIWQEIHATEFDVAIVSCGAYSSLISSYIGRVIGKDVIVLGGELTAMFGIKTMRTTRGQFNEFWISVQDNLKPKDDMKIENGCYW